MAHHSSAFPDLKAFKVGKISNLLLAYGQLWSNLVSNLKTEPLFLSKSLM